MHMSVDNIEESIAFYNAQFQTEPTKIKEDYAQWLVDDLSLNFAISTRGDEKGVNHLGLQYESDEALLEAQTLFESKGIKGKEDKGAVCCYKESNKYWVEDPSGIVWENYHSMGDVEVYGIDAKDTQDACCVPTFAKFSETPVCIPTNDGSKCC
ncbi:MAG: glyoxalase/bleomycin resistance/dioxygenase family protein [Sulfurovum sp.]|nr:glyoxalase/bleomycin resistance/dioxygenase family protein [Sulfurovum sp.]